MQSKELLKFSREQIQKGSKSFSLASFFLAPKERAGAWLLYSWCRYVDDLIDQAPSRETALIRLHALEEKTRAAFSETSENVEMDSPQLKGFQILVREFSIPAKYPLDLLRGMRMDIENQRYETLDDLKDYCYCVAGTVGLMMCHIMGLSDPRALQNAVDLGNAMQMTNISRDVLEDWQMGRIYFPRSWLREFDLNETSFGEPQNRKLWGKLSRRLLCAADAAYASGWRGLKFLPFRAAWAVGIAANVYHHIGHQVWHKDARAWDQRCYVSLPKKVILSGLTTLQLIPRFSKRLFVRWKSQPIHKTWGEA